MPDIIIPEYAFAAICIIWCAMTSRMCGGGLIANRLPTHMPESMFAAAFVLPALARGGEFIAFLPFIIAFAWMTTGHGTAFAMGRNPAGAQGSRKQYLSPIIDWLCAKFNQPLGGMFYCWAFMGFKGWLIGTAVPGLSCIAFAAFWPALYSLGWVLRERFKIPSATAFAEYATGAASGLFIWISCL